MKKLSLFLSIFVLLFLSACEGPGLSETNVKKEYYTGGQIRSEFIMNDDTGQNGLRKEYGYAGHVISTVHIRNGVPHGLATGYDESGRVLSKVTYINGKKDGMSEAYYQNGDVMVSYTYKNGAKEGPAQTYNKDGSIHRRVIYRNDKIVN
jgi:antitoxin component YwqK of YwqJK toxin-antitoxin module